MEGEWSVTARIFIPRSAAALARSVTVSVVQCPLAIVCVCVSINGFIL